jgi:hypothetical protein
MELDAGQRCLRGASENVARLELALQLPGTDIDGPQALFAAGEPLSVELDGQVLEAVAWPAAGRLVLERRDGRWSIANAAGPAGSGLRKTPARAGPFKEVFRGRVQLVHGTAGTPEENAWARHKARYDAETFWYRGNGALEVVPDREFDPGAEPTRNVVLYGNADTNAAWAGLLGDSPVQVRRGAARIGPHELAGGDLAVLAIYPRPGSAEALVGVVCGTGLPGSRLTERIPYFLSGVGLPDWLVLDPTVLRDGLAGVRAAGFYGPDWQIDPDQSGWRSSE